MDLGGVSSLDRGNDYETSRTKMKLAYSNKVKWIFSPPLYKLPSLMKFQVAKVSVDGNRLSDGLKIHISGGGITKLMGRKINHNNF